MQHKMLKLSALALMVAGATSANAAVYRVVEVTGDSSVADQQYYPEVSNDRLRQNVEFYGEAIAPSSAQNCFAQSCNETSFPLAGESRLGSEGVPIRDEVAYISDNLQHIVDRESLQRYCETRLGPNTCGDWALTRYYGKGYNTIDATDRTGIGGMVREQESWNNGYFANTTAMIEQSGNTMQPIETFADKSEGYDPAVTGVLGTISSTQSNDSVINQIIDDTGSDFLGVTTGAYFSNGDRNARQFDKRGFVNLGGNEVRLDPVQGNAMTQNAGQSLAWDSVTLSDGSRLVVGSASFSPSKFDDEDKVPDKSNDTDPGFSFDAFKSCVDKGDNLAAFFGTKECQLSVFANDAVFWSVDGTTGAVTAKALADRVDGSGREYPAQDPDENKRSFQASARAVSLVQGKPVVAGFTTDSVNNGVGNTVEGDYYAVRAAVYEPSTDFASGNEKWERKIIPGLSIKSDDERKLVFSMATDINDNNMVIGVAKNNVAQNRSYTERMFVYDNAVNASAPTFLNSGVSSLFFEGANGYPAAINNNNQIVGRVDAESINQVEGRFRRQRAFTYAMGEIPESAALKRGDVYFLDDLVNDGNKGGVANQFRIFDASDINDAGVISATAYKCDGGYDDLSKDSFCKGGQPGSERIVAVKLIPIDAGQSPSVQTRPQREESIEREGGSLGFLALSVLGLLGFRRRK
ncbi:hypothetical protein ABT56_17500 [Photobacterium aquae]|uniref:GlyGly-CTERM sorting domain-containing protein n=1 Tax=Photobacterium aquae TaxID=1195763 RepID=A0A0J1GWI4_9GAMM|nr:DUF3466 family protein [Photobacterium aquae]KLV03769.1 hypothetical protein ABT56_17500 [Photobacterium aquae]